MARPVQAWPTHRMSTAHDSSLGRSVDYPGAYAPELLFPIPRAPQRAALGLGADLPFHGEDLWTGYELGWLDARGKPRVAIAEFAVPATATHLVESKSFKLYLNGFAQERIASVEALQATLARDLSTAAGGDVAVQLFEPAHFPRALAGLAGDCIDGIELDIDCYGPPQSAFLSAAAGDEVEETLVSHLLRSNCPVTGQPDWASVQVAYAGPRLDRAGLLRYLVSFRQHSDFHEHCVERIFCDLQARCAPRRLSVYARYTRRGGLDINPYRSSEAGARAPRLRDPRQ